MNVSHHVVRYAAVTPDQPALIFEGRTITYQALARDASHVAAWLRAQGVGPQDRVALLLPNCPEFVIGYLATLYVGATVVSLNGASKARALRHMLDDCRPSIVFVTPGSATEVPWSHLANAPTAVVVDGAWPSAVPMGQLLEAQGAGIGPIDVEPDHPAAILYSSGTTGFPKGVVLSHRNVEFNSKAKRRYLGLRSYDRLMLFVPLFHVFGQNAILNAGLYSGATIVLCRRFHPDDTLADVARSAVTVFFGLPTVYAILLSRIQVERLGSVRMWFSAAATLPEDLARRWHKSTGLAIQEGYGLTETSPFTCFNHLHEHRLGSVGTPIEGVEIKVVDVSLGTDLSRHESGEVCVRGPNVMSGYWHGPDETDQAVVDGWFRTGDIGYLDDDGYLFLVDRLKDMVDVAGLKVWPSEVEQVLNEHPAVHLAAVFRRPDPDTGERVSSCVVLQSGASVTKHDLLTWCRQNLARYKVPVELRFVNELPMSPSGKILRRVLSAPAEEAEWGSGPLPEGRAAPQGLSPRPVDG